MLSVRGEFASHPKADICRFSAKGHLRKTATRRSTQPVSYWRVRYGLGAENKFLHCTEMGDIRSQYQLRTSNQSISSSFVGRLNRIPPLVRPMLHGPIIHLLPGQSVKRWRVALRAILVLRHFAFGSIRKSDPCRILRAQADPPVMESIKAMRFHFTCPDYSPFQARSK